MTQIIPQSNCRKGNIGFRWIIPACQSLTDIRLTRMLSFQPVWGKFHFLESFSTADKQWHRLSTKWLSKETQLWSFRIRRRILKITVIFYHNSQEQPPPANPLPHPVFRRMRSISLSSSDPQLHPARLPALDISHVIYHKAASEIKHLHLFRALTFQYMKTTSESKINGTYQPFWSKILQETL